MWYAHKGIDSMKGLVRKLLGINGNGNPIAAPHFKIGSHLRVLNEILELLDEIPPNPICSHTVRPFLGSTLR
jgi:hypothetical protein